MAIPRREAPVSRPALGDNRAVAATGVVKKNAKTNVSDHVIAENPNIEEQHD